MDANGLDADVLQAFCHLNYILAVVVPTEAGLDRHGLVHGIDDGFGEAHHLGNVLEHARPGALAHHFFYRTSVVNVNQVGVGLRTNEGSLDHALEFRTKNLDSNGALVLKNIELGAGLYCVANQALARNEFGVHQIGAVLLAQCPKRRIAHVFHRRKQQRKIRKLDVGNFYHGTKVPICGGAPRKWRCSPACWPQPSR